MKEEGKRNWLQHVRKSHASSLSDFAKQLKYQQISIFDIYFFVVVVLQFTHIVQRNAALDNW